MVCSTESSDPIKLTPHWGFEAVSSLLVVLPQARRVVPPQVCPVVLLQVRRVVLPQVRRVVPRRE
jgi:hypothetical protein